MMLQAFVDDSASDVGDKRLFLAAYINGADQWTAFSDAWDRKLRESPAIEYFKMSEAHSGRGQFDGWAEPERDRKVLGLAQVIRDHRPWSVHCSVSREQYGRIVAPVAPLGLKNAYFACFWDVMQVTAQYHLALEIEGVPPVDFVFDEQGGLGLDAVTWYEWLKAGQVPEVRSLLGATPVFHDDKQVVPLQAADMLAWHLRRWHERGQAEVLPALDLLIESRTHVCRDVDEATLKTIARGFRRVPGVDRVQDRRSWREAVTSARAQIAAGAGPPTANLLWMHWRNARLRLRDLINRMRYPRRRR